MQVRCAGDDVLSCSGCRVSQYEQTPGRNYSTTDDIVRRALLSHILQIYNCVLCQKCENCSMVVATSSDHTTPTCVNAAIQ